VSTGGFPVESVSWEDTVAFLDRLSALEEEQKEGRKYRLPSEGEWEHACRGGAPAYRVFHCGNSLCSTQANFAGKLPYGEGVVGPYRRRTCEAGSYRPNAFGLYDMHGNVWEWCSDWYQERYYGRSPWRDPQGVPAGSLRMLRGGSWASPGQDCRSARRRCRAPGLIRSSDMGFRVAFVASGSARPGSAVGR
jgi:formylglycine-generating enzyme required for sulfatase activity